MHSEILYFVLTLTGVFFAFNTVNLLYTLSCSELAAILSFPYETYCLACCPITCPRESPQYVPLNGN